MCAYIQHPGLFFISPAIHLQGRSARAPRAQTLTSTATPRRSFPSAAWSATRPSREALGRWRADATELMVQVTRNRGRTWRSWRTASHPMPCLFCCFCDAFASLRIENRPMTDDVEVSAAVFLCWSSWMYVVAGPCKRVWFMYVASGGLVMNCVQLWSGLTLRRWP